MTEKYKSYAGVLIIIILASLAITGWILTSAYTRSVVPNRVIAASGEGKASVVPDIVNFSFGVLTEGGKNLAVLTKENNDKTNQIISSLKENGVSEKDIFTQLYNITPRYQYFTCNPTPATNATPCPPAEIVGYSVNQNVFVKIRNIAKAGDIVNAVVDKGANTVSGLSFTIDDPSKIKNQARQDAFAKAKESASALASSGGFRLGKLISVHEGTSVVPLGQTIATIPGKGGSGGDLAQPIEPGTQDVVVTMSLIYEIK